MSVSDWINERVDHAITLALGLRVDADDPRWLTTVDEDLAAGNEPAERPVAAPASFEQPGFTAVPAGQRYENPVFDNGPPTVGEPSDLT
jgi:hypothetical protein